MNHTRNHKCGADLRATEGRMTLRRGKEYYRQVVFLFLSAIIRSSEKKSTSSIHAASVFSGGFIANVTEKNSFSEKVTKIAQRPLKCPKSAVLTCWVGRIVGAPCPNTRINTRQKKRSALKRFLGLSFWSVRFGCSFNNHGIQQLKTSTKPRKKNRFAFAISGVSQPTGSWLT